jgi:glycosyltransferase involved in cell wall biosynthesis
MEKISVAMCTYNGEHYISEQLDSILNQTLKVDEIVVCDDQSTDKTIEILENYSTLYPSIIKIYRNEVNLRSVKNFEKAISLCSGDIILLSDQDDYWVTNKVEEYLKFFTLNKSIDVIASNGYCVDNTSKIIEKYTIWDMPQLLKENNITFHYNHLITHVGNFVTGASIGFRKVIVPKILPFPILKGFHHDEWIAIIATRTNSFEMLNEKYFFYRIHDNQQVGGVTYTRNNKTKNSFLQGFDLNVPKTFIGFKRRLKKLHANYSKIIDLHEASEHHKEMLKDIAEEIKNDYFKMQSNFKKTFPIRYFLLSISDKIFNKRQFKVK